MENLPSQGSTGNRRADNFESRDSDKPVVGEVSKRPRLLAVEDNPELLILLRHILRADWDLTTATNMESALDEIDKAQFDIVLMDINLGTDETGVDVLHAMRTRANYRSTPIIAVTAYALPGDRERFLEQGFDDYIGKPFTRQQLLRLLSSLTVEQAH